MSNSKPSLQFWILFVISISVLIRLLSLGLYPLMDTTEARYGEMARLMVETNNWVTPYFDYGVPFLGKPPMFIWLSAISFKLFGINEFAARFPSLICALLNLFVLWKLASFAMDRTRASITVMVLITSAAFLVLAGAVLADPVMTLSISLILSAFWIGWHSTDPMQARRWQYLFYVGCGIALLAKGLAAIVLAGGPIFFWCLFRKQLLSFWHRFPWIKGTLLTLAIALPWYLAAEAENPGLIEYMFIGEHFSRYLDSGWQGDEYGNAHVHPLGSIWGYLLLGGTPWSLVIIGLVIYQVKRGLFKHQQQDLTDWHYFLFCWLLFLPIFFTFTNNLIWTYMLPVTPALALLIAALWPMNNDQPNKGLFWFSAVTPVLMIITVVLMMNDGGQKSQKYIFDALNNKVPNQSGNIIYFMDRPFSARFYSNGTALLADNQSELTESLTEHQDILVTKKKFIAHLPEGTLKNFRKEHQYRDWILFIERK
ncbi:hypothetical protein EOPP23_03750 [Endozoicomonas sp. OPT23]|uniref:ArnT family glycosyltransferase n=1 Tax=Endozoicomonas sp. OPT23 TaxID=2072845 RepID=UPI00129A4D17|nr:glycosyltransferase family 39 protein [Endozoicomonas sp. OPT23]MRI32108.1 hypothetical protein [Endozoicomonas sp. OPT23]